MQHWERYRELIRRVTQLTAGLKLGPETHAAKQRARTHCKRGHEFSPENTLVNAAGARVCKRCRRENERRRREKKRDERRKVVA